MQQQRQQQQQQQLKGSPESMVEEQSEEELLAESAQAVCRVQDDSMDQDGAGSPPLCSSSPSARDAKKWKGGRSPLPSSKAAPLSSISRGAFTGILSHLSRKRFAENNFSGESSKGRPGPRGGRGSAGGGNDDYVVSVAET